MRRLTDSFARDVADNPSIVREELEGEMISPITATFLIGRLIRPEHFLSQLRNEEFEGYWRERLGARSKGNFVKRASDAVVEKYLIHIADIVKEMQENPEYDGVWPTVWEDKIFRLASDMGADIDIPEEDHEEAGLYLGVDDDDHESSSGADSRMRSEQGLSHLDRDKN